MLLFLTVNFPMTKLTFAENEKRFHHFCHDFRYDFIELEVSTFLRKKRKV